MIDYQRVDTLVAQASEEKKSGSLSDERKNQLFTEALALINHCNQLLEGIRVRSEHRLRALLEGTT